MKNATEIQPLPRTAEGRIDWRAAGFAVLTHDPKDGELLQVAEKGKTYPGALILRINDLDAARLYMLDESILGALDGSSFRVKQQAVCRAYLIHLNSQSPKPPAWNEDGTLKDTYRDILLDKIWKNLNGIRLEREATTVREVVKIVEKRVISLPNGEEWTPTETEPDAQVMELYSAWMDALMQDGEDVPDAKAATDKKLERGHFHKMLGVAQASE